MRIFRLRGSAALPVIGRAKLPLRPFFNCIVPAKSIFREAVAARWNLSRRDKWRRVERRNQPKAIKSDSNRPLDAGSFCRSATKPTSRNGYRFFENALSRNHVVEGSARALACGVARPRATHQGVRNPHHSVRRRALVPTGEGAGRHTRGRVCSPKSTASFRLSRNDSVEMGSATVPVAPVGVSPTG